MQSKVNIFHTLQHNSDSEDESNVQSNKAKKTTEKREQRAQNQPKPTGNKAPVAGSQKEDHSKAKGPQKQKGVTAEPHPLDRHSGHGNQAYGAKPKKSGAGKGNWGSYKEDRKGGEEQVVAGEGAEEGVEEKPQEEEPAGITLSEYYSQRTQAQNAPQVNEAKAKITSEQLTKELGNATALKTRAQQQVDDKKVGKKKDRLDVNHHAAINSEYADLLNFRTGFVEKEYKQRERGVGDEAGQRRPGPRTGQKERENAKEGETQGQATEGQTAEGQAPVEGQTQEATAGEGTSPTRAGGDDRRRNEGQRGGRGGRGGYRGDRPQGDRPQGDRPQGDRPQGDRPQGDRPPRKQQQAKVNFEDESLFPKLG